MFGVIVCNPPWLSRKMPLYPSGFLQLESGIHDTSHYFLKSSLLLARKIYIYIYIYRSPPIREWTYGDNI